MHFVKYFNSPLGTPYIHERLWENVTWMYDFNQAQNSENNNFMYPVNVYTQVGTYPGFPVADLRGTDPSGYGQKRLESTEDHYYAEVTRDLGDGRSFCYDLVRPWSGDGNYYAGELIHGAWTGHETYTFGFKLVWDSADNGVADRYLLDAYESSTTAGTRIYKNASNQIVWTVYDVVGGTQTCTSSAIPFDTKMSLIFEYDAIAGTMEIWSGTTGSGTVSQIGTHNLTANAKDVTGSLGTHTMLGGKYNGASTPTNIMTGKFDQFWAFGILLTDEEKAFLADAWDMSLEYFYKTGNYWWPGDKPAELHFDPSWWAANFQGGAGSYSQPGNPADGWVENDGDDVQRIKFRSGNEGTLLATSNFPTLQTDPVSGNKYWQFSGQHLQMMAPTYRVYTRRTEEYQNQTVDWNNCTHVFVVRADAGMDTSCIFSSFNDWFGTSPNVVRKIFINASTVWAQEQAGTGTTISGSVPDTTGFHIYAVVFSGSTAKLYVDSAVLPVDEAENWTGTCQQGNDTLRPVLFGSKYDYNYFTGSSNPMDCGVGEYVFYEDTLSPTELNRIFTDLRNKWSIS